MLEDQEETIEKWYFDKNARRDVPLEKHLCEDHVLKNRDSSCLREVHTPSVEEKQTLKSKGDKGKKDL